MSIQTFFTLTDRARLDVREIWESCLSREPITVSPIFFEEVEVPVTTLILYQKQTPAAFLTAAPLDDETWEISAFTRPECRKKGFFHTLLKELKQQLALLPGPLPSFQFYEDGNSEDTKELLSHLSCRRIDCEYLMALALKDAELSHDPRLTAEVCSDPEVLCATHARIFEWPLSLSEEYLDFSLCEPDSYGYLLYSKGHKAGCFGLRVSGKTACLFGFGLYRRYRGKGLAHPALAAVCRCLPPTCRSLEVQVSESNEAAFGFYQKAGFQTKSRLALYQLL